jgi:two-component system, cell cycle sensor histidine kinase and response regulator CckA
MQPAELFACLDLLPDPALVADRDGTIVFATALARDLLGRGSQTLAGEPLSRWIALGARGEPEAQLETRDLTGTRSLREPGGALPRLDLSAREIELGERRAFVILLRAAGAPREAGAPTQADAGSEAGQAHDHASLAEALLRNEQRLRHATQAAQVGIFDHPVLPEPPPPPYWSPILREMLAIGPDEPADFMWFRGRVHPDDGFLLDQAVAQSRSAESDGSIDMTYRWLHPEKGYRWLLNRSVTEYVVRDGQRLPQRSIGAILDVTERRAAEEEQLLRAAILDATPDFVAISLLDGTLVYLNKTARRFLGLDEAQPLAGRSLNEAHPAAVADLLQRVAIPTAVEHGAWSADTEFLQRDGALVPMSHLLLAQRDSAGHVAYLCTIARDLSKERKLEEQFRQAQKMEAVGRLAGGVAHDFNNLLSVILGYAELAAAELAAQHEARRALSEIIRAAERAAALTSQLLAFGRRQILKPRVLDINEVLSDFAPMLSRLIDERIEIHVIPAAKPANIRADPNQVQQILLNLVVNARDAMPEGGVLTLEAFRATLDESQTAERLNLRPGVYTVIAVSDTGHGMDAATRDRIFEPFFTTKGPGRGTGLGLSTVFGIVQQSGGSIWVYSEPERGTTFKIYLPGTEEPAETPLVPAPVVHGVQSGVILLSEDDEQVREMVSNILLRAGYQVLSAATPAAAIALSNSHAGRIDLLITDVVMPGMTGTVLAQRLHQTRPELPVLFTSGYTENTIVHQGVLDDGVDFLAKPITPGRLLTAVLEITQRAR